MTQDWSPWLCFIPWVSCPVQKPGADSPGRCGLNGAVFWLDLLLSDIPLLVFPPWPGPVPASPPPSGAGPRLVWSGLTTPLLLGAQSCWPGVKSRRKQWHGAHFSSVVGQNHTQQWGHILAWTGLSVLDVMKTSSPIGHWGEFRTSLQKQTSWEEVEKLHRGQVLLFPQRKPSGPVPDWRGTKWEHWACRTLSEGDSCRLDSVVLSHNVTIIRRKQFSRGNVYLNTQLRQMIWRLHVYINININESVFMMNWYVDMTSCRPDVL